MIRRLPGIPGSPVVAVDDRRSAAAHDSTAATAVADRRYKFFELLFRLPARALLALVWLYQRTLSPALPAIFGPACGCRFSPTCSQYAAGAIRARGAVLGSILAVRRLLKCSPLHPGGLDPVPPRRAPRCTRITSLASNL